jgi:hypothetical protein
MRTCCPRCTPQESLEKTNLGDVREGDRVDVERCVACMECSAQVLYMCAVSDL